MGHTSTSRRASSPVQGAPDAGEGSTLRPLVLPAPALGPTDPHVPSPLNPLPAQPSLPAHTPGALATHGPPDRVQAGSRTRALRPATWWALGPLPGRDSHACPCPAPRRPFLAPHPLARLKWCGEGCAWAADAHALQTRGLGALRLGHAKVFQSQVLQGSAGTWPVCSVSCMARSRGKSSSPRTPQTCWIQLCCPDCLPPSAPHLILTGDLETVGLTGWTHSAGVCTGLSVSFNREATVSRLSQSSPASAASFYFCLEPTGYFQAHLLTADWGPGLPW